MKETVTLSEIVAIAQQLDAQFGEQARDTANARADQSAAKGDREAVSLWKRVAEAVRLLQRAG